VSRYQKDKTNLDFTEARDSEWQWHQLGHMQVCTSLQTNNQSSTPPLSFLQAGCPSCRPTNSVKALKAQRPHTERLFNRVCRARGGRLFRDEKAICRKSRRVGARQREICERESEIVREVSLSVVKAVDQCQQQFRDRRWNCSLDRRRVAAQLLNTGLNE